MLSVPFLDKIITHLDWGHIITESHKENINEQYITELLANFEVETLRFNIPLERGATAKLVN
jgi:hypothetical protein